MPAGRCPKSCSGHRRQTDPPGHAGDGRGRDGPEVVDAFFAAVGRGDLARLLAVLGGVITAIRVLTDPDRLAQVVPSWVA